MDFINLIYKRHVVKKARESVIYFHSDIPKTYQAGTIDNVQVCCYDKRTEMKTLPLEKRELTITHGIGRDWWESDQPITRVEFRLGRTVLRCLGANTIEELLEREQGIIDLVTNDWFRLLERPKVDGRGQRAKMHPLWHQVRALFFQFFTGNTIRDVTYRQPEPISCDPTSMLKQASGCIAKAVALQNGKQASSDDITQYVQNFYNIAKEDILHKANQRVEEMNITKGIELGRKIDENN